jgi:hypothetical protein
MRRFGWTFSPSRRGGGECLALLSRKHEGLRAHIVLASSPECAVELAGQDTSPRQNWELYCALVSRCVCQRSCERRVSMSRISRSTSGIRASTGACNSPMPCAATTGAANCALSLAINPLREFKSN